MSSEKEMSNFSWLRLEDIHGNVKLAVQDR